MRPGTYFGRGLRVASPAPVAGLDRTIVAALCDRSGRAVGAKATAAIGKARSAVTSCIVRQVVAVDPFLCRRALFLQHDSTRSIAREAKAEACDQPEVVQSVTSIRRRGYCMYQDARGR